MIITDFARRLLTWQHAHGRHQLPWQGDSDPYPIWLSEIMLQQTRVESVIPYFERFISRFPDVRSLANASQEEVMSLWSGLGYYARARNLHHCARLVVSTHGGQFPRSAAALASLPGIGRSTAAAIAAFAFGERAAILDGNVKRVLCRLFAIEGHPGQRAVEQQLWTLAESLLPNAQLGRYTQAQMDLGALICTRSRPACERCPFRDDCQAFAQGRTGELPAPRPRKTLPNRQARYAVIRRGEQVLVEHRPPSGIWGGLLGLPELPATVDTPARWLAQHFGLHCNAVIPLPGLRHLFTHFSLDVEPLLFDIELDATFPRSGEASWRWLALAELDQAALPTPVRRILGSLPSRSQHQESQEPQETQPRSSPQGRMS